jgi:hypothetical protein
MTFGGGVCLFHAFDETELEQLSRKAHVKLAVAPVRKKALLGELPGWQMKRAPACIFGDECPP